MNKKNYISPKITKVEFQVEVGLDGSITGTNRDTWEAIIPSEDGTETYSYRDGDGGFF